MANVMVTNAKCNDCKTNWYEPILITYRCPNCKSTKIKIAKPK